jgi:hypothetical protein
MGADICNTPCYVYAKFCQVNSSFKIAKWTSQLCIKQLGISGPIWPAQSPAVALLAQVDVAGPAAFQTDYVIKKN